MNSEVAQITRKCGSCRIVKTLDEFGTNKAKKHGKQHRCKPCMRAIDAARRANPDVRRKEAAANKAYRSSPEVKKRMAESHRLYYEKHADKYRERSRERHHRLWSERLIYSARTASRQRIARGRDCPMLITKEHLEELWVRQGGLCYFTGIAMTFDRDRLDTVSADRLDPSKGYEVGNVVLATKSANFAKTGHSESEFREYLDKVADSILSNRKEVRSLASAARCLW